MSVSLSLGSKSSNGSSVSLQEEYSLGSGCRRCALFLAKCREYRTIIKRYKRRQAFVRLLRVFLFLIACWIGYRLYQMYMMKKQEMQIYEIFRN